MREGMQPLRIAGARQGRRRVDDDRGNPQGGAAQAI